MLTAGAVFAGLAAAVAALVPYLSAPHMAAQPFQRDPGTPVVQLRDGRNISYQVLIRSPSHVTPRPPSCAAHSVAW